MATTGFVYLFRVQGHDIYKVGASVDPPRRLKSVQAKHPGLVLELTAAIRYTDHERAECAWHLEWKKYRLAAEWFVLPAFVVEKFASIAGRPEATSP